MYQETPLHQIGNTELLQRQKTAFLCSRRIPSEVLTRVLKWVDGLVPERDCVLCGAHSQVERAAFERLLERRVPTVLCLAEALKTEWPDEIATALHENRLLIVTHCDDTVHLVSGSSAADRNRLMLSLANEVVVGYCTPGGNVERQIAGRTGGVTFLVHTVPVHTHPASPASFRTFFSRFSRWFSRWFGNRRF